MNTIKIAIPYGFGEALLTEEDVRHAQLNNIKTISLNEKDGRIIDAILSYFVLNCMPNSCNYEQQTHKRISNL